MMNAPLANRLRHRESAPFGPVIDFVRTSSQTAWSSGILRHAGGEMRRNVNAVLFASIVAITAVQSAAAAPILPGVYNATTGSTYYLLSSSSWQDAESQALSVGGHLVTINDEAENSWLFSTFGPYDQQNGFWIGLHKNIIGDWTWVSGEAVTFLNWDDGEPNNWFGHEDSGMMYGPQTNPSPKRGKWNDAPSSGFDPQQLNGIAEVTAVPEPSSVCLFATGLVLFGAGAVRVHYRFGIPQRKRTSRRQGG
jgi:hypothetical protein